LYNNPPGKIRKTIEDHLYSFRRYDKDNIYYYMNAVTGFGRRYLWQKYDLVILHYSLLALRYHNDIWKRLKVNLISFLENIDTPKVAIPQDEYNQTYELCHLFKKASIETVFTCSTEDDFRKIYPFNLSGVTNLFQTLTGYVDEDTLEILRKKKMILDHSKRRIDIGYRARKLPYWLGRHGQIKTEIGLIFNKESIKYEDLIFDISTDQKDVFLGVNWLEFLCNSRTVLGCLGGSGLLDFYGKIKTSVDNYVLEHPDATFDEVEEACFKNEDNKISVFALSPRHFECAMTRSCQILVEGDYYGIFRPNIDFIELKRDFSNIDEVIDMVKDKNYCEKIADNCYKHVILSESNTYKGFVNSFYNTLFDNKIIKRDNKDELYFVDKIRLILLYIIDIVLLFDIIINKSFGQLLKTMRILITKILKKILGQKLYNRGKAYVRNLRS
jgi:hypothetical protein